MGISIAICEKDAPSASCASLKKDVKKVYVNDVSVFGDAAEYDTLVSLEDAKALFSDFDAFIKRNRINEETDAIYLDKVKKDDDLAILEPKSVKKYTGWVKTEGLSEDLMIRAIELSKPEDRVTGWDLLDFDQMNDMCANCPLSWDKGRGCIGAYGPDNSLLPGIAEKYDCPIVASAPEGAKTGRMYTSAEAAEMKKEVEKLQSVLPDEGKMAVRRYAGPLERLGAVAEISAKEGCNFYFF